MTREFNASNKPNTCLWCGQPLHRNSTVEAVRRETPRGFTTDTIRTLTEERGWNGNGFFCSLRCGEAFGVAMAKNGRRLQPREDA